MMSPMGTVSAAEDGKATDWHTLHYGARGLGQVGLIMLRCMQSPSREKTQAVLAYGATSTFPRCKKSCKPSMTKAPKMVYSFGMSDAKAPLPQETAISASGLPHRKQYHPLDRTLNWTISTIIGVPGRIASPSLRRIVSDEGVKLYNVLSCIIPLMYRLA